MYDLNVCIKNNFLLFQNFYSGKGLKNPLDKLILSSDSSYVERIHRFETTLMTLTAKPALWIKDIKTSFKKINREGC